MAKQGIFEPFLFFKEVTLRIINKNVYLCERICKGATRNRNNNAVMEWLSGRNCDKILIKKLIINCA